jgi:hypothetical protein
MADMSIQLPSYGWKGAAEYFAKEDDFQRQYDAEFAAHEKAPLKAPSCVYSNCTSTPRVLSDSRWREEQRYRLMAPIGARVLLRRANHSGVIQDTMMIRVNAVHRWECMYVLYLDGEASPVPVPSKKRKCTDF